MAMEHIHSKVTSTMQHLRDRLSSCFCYSLVERHKFHTLIQIFRILHKMAPSYLQKLFKYSSDVTGHPGRIFNRLYVPQVKTNYGKQSLYFILWNNLSPSLILSYSYIPLRVGYYCYYTRPGSRRSGGRVLITMISYECSGI